jgi:hypothetical protein
VSILSTQRQGYKGLRNKLFRPNPSQIHREPASRIAVNPNMDVAAASRVLS